MANISNPPNNIPDAIQWLIAIVQQQQRRISGVQSGGSGGSLAIGSPISGADPGNVLFAGNTSLLAKSDGFIYDGFNLRLGTAEFITLDALGATQAAGLFLQNTTPATSGAQSQYPPALYMLGTQWNNSASVVDGFRHKITSTRTSAQVKPTYDFDFTTDGGSTWNNVFRMAMNGSAATTGTFTFTGSAAISNTLAVTGQVTTNGGTVNLLSTGLALSPGLTISINTTTTASALAGTATLSSGTVTVNTTSIQTGDIIMLSCNTPGGTAGLHYTAPVASIINNTSFVINSVAAAGTVVTTDSSTINWWVIRPN